MRRLTAIDTNMGSHWGAVNNNSNGEGSIMAGNGKGYGQVLSSPRYSGPMTRRALSFKRNPDVEVANSPVSDRFAGDEGEWPSETRLGVQRQASQPKSIEQQSLYIKTLMRRSAAIASSVNKEKGLGQWVFCFCGLLIFFLILMKISTIGWLGSHLEQLTGPKCLLFTIEVNSGEWAYVHPLFSGIDWRVRKN